MIVPAVSALGAAPARGTVRRVDAVEPPSGEDAPVPTLLVSVSPPKLLPALASVIAPPFVLNVELPYAKIVLPADWVIE